MEEQSQHQHQRVELLLPESKNEISMANVMEAFSNFVLKEGKESCLSVLRLDKYSDQVGELQGGNDEYSIYRVVINNDGSNGNSKNAVSELIDLFHSSTQSSSSNKNNNKILTTDTFQEYMLGICDRFSSGTFVSLGNAMLVISFGATTGQVRHIDRTYPNSMICLYMSRSPTTIIYSSSPYSSCITNCDELIDFWEEEEEQERIVPDLIKDILLEREHTDLSGTYFSSLKTLGDFISDFGKLYLPLDIDSELYDPATEPGTTLIASGKAVVHSGPPTTGPRMFAYAIGVYNSDESYDDNKNDGSDDKDNNKDGKINDGEVQYSPALVQLDLSCLVFDWMKNVKDYSDRTQEEHLDAKQFMVRLLVDKIVDMQQNHGNETYDRLLPDDRMHAREWIGRVVHVGTASCGRRVTTTGSIKDNSHDDYEALIEEGIMRSDQIFSIPAIDTATLSSSSSTKRRNKRNQKKKIRKERQSISK